MGLKEVKIELKKLNKEELIKQISELYKKYKPVKEYFDFYINPDETALLKEYKEKVREGFYPKDGFQLKLSLSRKAINDFKKLGASKESIFDLLLYFVECGVQFTIDYGDIDEAFYESIENTYERAISLISKENLLDKFQDRAIKIVNDTSGMGWWFHDNLEEMYFKYYEIKK